MTNIKNKIEAADTSISGLLKDQKFFIDYFQREYRWQEKHMTALIEDLTGAFLRAYDASHGRPAVANYPSYYLGPVVFSVADGKNSIIDGQQRITSLTLLLIYLHNQQKDKKQQVNIESLVFSETYGQKSFNMTDPDRQEVLRSLFDGGSYSAKDTEEETVINIAKRYEDIHKVFPDDIDEHALPYFIDWLIGNVVMVKITAYSDENAYTIFETMNDRGLSLTPTEMLKGYVLSRIGDREKRKEVDTLWKASMKRLHEWEKDADLEFFKAWFRAKYAVSMRPRKADSENQDYEQIGTRFHDWFKNNHEEKLGIRTGEDFYQFFITEFGFYLDAFLEMWFGMEEEDNKAPHLHYMEHWGVAYSLEYPLVLAALKSEEDKDIRFQKMDAVARFIETYTVRRSINFKKFDVSAIQYTFFNFIKGIRDLSLNDLKGYLKTELEQMPQNFEAVSDFGIHQQNRRFVKHLLSRITAFVDRQVGMDTDYKTYHHPDGKAYEIEHLWSAHYEEHLDEFEEEWEFWRVRNAIGALVLLPNGTNQSFGDDKYETKLPHYLKENRYAQTLHPTFYEKNPNFRKSQLNTIPFQAHDKLNRESIQQRNQVVKALCESIWSTEYYKNEE